MSEALNPFDTFVLVVLALLIFWGGLRGIVAQAASIFSWVASWYVSTHYYSFVARFLDENVPWRIPVATVITFIVTALAIRLAANFVKSAVSFAGLKEFDRQMGALLGFAKGVLLCLLITFFGVILSDKTRDMIHESKSGPFFVSVISRVQDRLPDSGLTNRFHEIAESFRDKNEGKEETLGAQADDLSQQLVNKGLLSNVSSRIVKDAKKISEDSNSENKTQTTTSLLNSLKSAADSISKSLGSWRSGGASAASPNGTGTSSSAAGPTVYAGNESNVSSRQNSGSVSSNGVDSYYANSNDDFSYRRANASTSSERSNASETASATESEPSGFLDWLGGVYNAFDRNSNANDDNRRSASISENTNDSYRASYGEYSNNRDSGYESAARSRSSRSSDSGASRARLGARSYVITSSEDYD